MRRTLGLDLGVDDMAEMDGPYESGELGEYFSEEPVEFFLGGLEAYFAKQRRA